MRRTRGLFPAVVAVMVTVAMVVATQSGVSADDFHRHRVVRAALPSGSIKHIVVIDLENEGFSTTFGPGSPATYLNNTLLSLGELIPNYFAVGHVSLDNYVAQVSGQAPTPLTSSDCTSTAGGGFHPSYVDVLPGSDDPKQLQFPGQVDGDGCVFPAPRNGAHGAPTIADQLDAEYPSSARTDRAPWRGYVEDMGNNPARDGGTPDPLGGTDCAHPALGGSDSAEFATATDQYATRHNPFVYFHSIIDSPARCRANVVPLGTVTVGTASRFAGALLPDTFHGHLVDDLRRPATTPRFAFITPNLCDDGHDGTCAGTNTEGNHTGGLVGADLWLKHWTPLLLASPAYRNGSMLIVVTFDEAGIGDTTACCGERPGPNWAFPGHSPLLGPAPTTPGADPGGGKTGAVLLNARFIRSGTVDTTGSYNHYSALRSYEDLLGLHEGGVDGLGHLGFAAAPGLEPFGRDVFNRAPPCHSRRERSDENRECR